MEITPKIPKVFKEIFEGNARYRAAYGGRGSAKSMTFARMAILRAVIKKELILCARELQNSIADSVHRLLKEQIEELNLSGFFDIQKAIIRGKNGSEFIFKGLRNNYSEIKSTQGVTICWIEEAEAVSADSWDVLTPTIREPDSEIWLTFNPKRKNAPTYIRFVLNAPENSKIKKIYYWDNPYFPDVLRQEMEHDKRTDYDKYRHVWLGECKESSEAQIFHGKWAVDRFCPPKKWHHVDGGAYFGADWGFAKDPTVLLRCWINDKKLYIDYEAHQIGCELDNLPILFDKIPESRKHLIRADNSRPETINHVAKKGFRIEAAQKWPGSVEDGVEYIRSFEKIIIHERCENMIQEAEDYCYKVDRLTNDITRDIIDANNHCWDAIRYALSPLIQSSIYNIEALSTW